MPHLPPVQPPVELVVVVEVGMGEVEGVEENRVVGVGEVVGEVVGTEEEGRVGLVEERDETMVEGDVVGRTLDERVGRDEVGAVELLPTGVEEADVGKVEAVMVAVGTAAMVNLSAVIPQQEQAEE